MATLKLSIETSNSAFQDEGTEYELARILEALAKRIQNEGATKGQEYVLRDINGNKVGTATFEE